MTARPPFLAIPRAALESVWYRAASALTRALWIELYHLANYGESTTRKGQKIGPGQLVTSWSFLADRLSCTQRDGRRCVPDASNIRRAAAFLEKANEVTWQTAKYETRDAGTVITLTRWDFYQGHCSSETKNETEQTPANLVRCVTTQEERDLPPVTQGVETKTLSLEERRERARETERAEIEETRRILAEERRLREGVKDETVH